MCQDKKKKVQMKEQINVAEKIQLSDKKIANLPDAQSQNWLNLFEN